MKVLLIIHLILLIQSLKMASSKPKHIAVLLNCFWVGCVSGLRDTAASRKPDTQPTAPHQTGNLKNKAPNTTGSNHLHNTLELLMMGTMVPETC